MGRNSDKRSERRKERTHTEQKDRETRHARAAVRATNNDPLAPPWWAEQMYEGHGWTDGPDPTLSAALFRVSALLVACGFAADEEEALQPVAEELRVLLGADTLSFHRLEEDEDGGSKLKRVASVADLKSDRGLLTFSPEDELAGAALKNGRLVGVEDAARDERVLRAHGQRTHVGSLLVAPMTFSDQAVGVLVATRREVRGFGSADEARIQLVAASLAQDLHQARLLKQALLDPETRLFSRMALLEALPRELERARRYETPLSLIMLHIDGLRDTVERFGIEVAREVMAEVGRRLPSVVRRSDLTVRFGAEVFAVLSPANAEVAAGAADRLVHTVTDAPFDAGDVTIELQVSASAATLAAEDEDALGFLLRAEQSLPLPVIKKARPA